MQTHSYDHCPHDPSWSCFLIANTINPPSDDSSQPPQSITSELSMPTFFTHQSPGTSISAVIHSHLIWETTPPARQTMKYIPIITGPCHNKPTCSHTPSRTWVLTHQPIWSLPPRISHTYSSFPPISHKFPSISYNIETSSSRLLYHWSPTATFIEHSFQKHNPQGVQHRPQSQHPMQKPSPSQHRM